MKVLKKDVGCFLPHREPFLFIDEIEEIKKEGVEISAPVSSMKEIVGIEVNARYKTKNEHPIFSGHFPGRPILPGVIQVEMMAQASIFCMFAAFKNPFEMDSEFALVSVESAKFRKPIFPEMQLNIHSLCLKVRGSMLGHDAQILHGEEVISECRILSQFKVKS